MYIHYGASKVSLICHDIWQIALKWGLKVAIIHLSLIIYATYAQSN